jgi:hypothetical protein
MNLYSRRDLNRPRGADFRNLTVTVTARGYRRRLRVGTPRVNEDVVAGGANADGVRGEHDETDPPWSR